jgi:colanic acid biosynthesis glycosyl transferase WcaI
VPAALVAWLRRARLMNWTQDLFPEIAQSLAVPGIALAAPLLRRLRNLSLAMAEHNVVLGEQMAAHLRQEGIAPEKIAVIHNWSLSEVEAPCHEACQTLRREWGLSDKLVVGYSGNFGRAHDFATAIAAARLLVDRDDVRFLFIGDGAQRGWLEEQSRGLPNLLLKPYQPLERLPVTLSLPDVHLVSLKTELEGLLVPSKLYAVLSAGRPVFFVGDGQGEIARLLETAGAGRAFAVGAGDALAAAIRELAAEPARAVAMGERSRALWNERFKRSQAHAAWRTLLENLTSCRTR